MIKKLNNGASKYNCMKKQKEQTTGVVNSPKQYTAFGKFMRGLLRFKIVKHICFNLGLKGFNKVGWQQIRNGKVIKQGFTYNARVDKGADLSASLLAGESLNSISSPAAPIDIALGTSTLTPDKGDTTLTDETSVSGLARTTGTIQNYSGPSSLDGACSYEVYNEFTNGGATTTIRSSALFDTNSNMFVEANLDSDAVLESSDILKITWTVNL